MLLDDTSAACASISGHMAPWPAVCAPSGRCEVPQAKVPLIQKHHADTSPLPVVLVLQAAHVTRQRRSFAETRDRAGDLQIFSLTLSQLSYRGCWLWVHAPG